VSPLGTAARALGTIDGIVSDTNLVPLQAAFVSVLGTNIRIGTGPNGRFRITKVPVGQYLVIVKRVGYRPTSAVIDVPASDTVRLAYTLERIAETLNPVIVTEKSPTKRMAEFEERRRLGVGQFMTADEIKARNSVYTTEVLRNFTTVNVSPDHSGPITQYYAISKREGGNPQLGACPMQVYLDQVPLPSPFNLDLLPTPKDIGGIEVYAGASTIPPQFNGFDRGCGVILIWTKDSSVNP
jgi:carboxypeptidase family protein